MALPRAISDFHYGFIKKYNSIENAMLFDFYIFSLFHYIVPHKILIYAKYSRIEKTRVWFCLQRIHANVIKICKLTIRTLILGLLLKFRIQLILDGVAEISVQLVVYISDKLTSNVFYVVSFLILLVQRLENFISV